MNLELVALTARFKHSPCDTIMLKTMHPDFRLLICLRIPLQTLFIAFGLSSVVARSLQAGENGAGWDHRGGISTTAASIDLIQGKIGEAESDTDATRLNFERARPRGQIGHLRPQLREKLTRIPCCPRRVPTRQRTPRAA